MFHLTNIFLSPFSPRLVVHRVSCWPSLLPNAGAELVEVVPVERAQDRPLVVPVATEEVVVAAALVDGKARGNPVSG